MKRKLLLRFLLTLFTIFCCITIAGAAVQEMHTRVVFEKACVLEGETSFSAEFVAAKTPAVSWNNGWRTADGKFASPLGGGSAGAAAEQSVWNAVAQKPCWSVIEGRVSVRNAAGDLRIYDCAAVSPRGRVICLEVKSGGASYGGSLSAFDAGVNTFNPAIGVGQNAELIIGRSLLIRRP